MKTVLIAEDEPGVRLLARVTVDSDRYAIIEAADGDEAWRLIQQHQPSVVVLDVRMPGRTGLELTRAIKDDPALAATRVILLTAGAQPSDIAVGLAAGADRYLTKPFSPAELLAAVEAALAVQ